jgi:MFS family permease
VKLDVTAGVRTTGPSMVALLGLAHFAGYADRAIPAVFAPGLKATFALSDVQLGALQGAPFVVSYVLATLWAGRRTTGPVRPGPRVGLCILLWTVAAVVFALAPNYPTLLGARMAFGLGQAAFAPMALAMLAGARPIVGIQPVGIFTAGSATGRSGGILLGGLVLTLAAAAGVSDRVDPWRIAALLMLVPNLVLAVVFLSRRTAGSVPDPSGGGLRDALIWVGGRPLTVVLYMVAACGTVMMVQSLGAWSPSIIGRQFGMGPASAAVLVGVATLIAAPAGHLLAGRSGTLPWFTVQGPGPALGISAAVAIPAVIGLSLAPTPALAAACLAVLIVASGFGAGIALIGLQGLAPVPLRRGMNSLFLALVTVFGTAGGPLITGAVSDRIASNSLGLGQALAIVVVGAALIVIAASLAGAGGWRRLTAEIRSDSVAPAPL